MKSFIVAAIFAVLVAQTIAAPLEENDLEEIARPERSSMYAVPASPSYGGGYAPAVGPAKAYAYGSPAPVVPCGTNLIFGCHPNVAPVPCAANSGYSSGYSSGSYSAAPAGY